MRISDLQLDSDLDSIRNFYGVFIKSIFRPKACHTYWESLCISSQFRLFGTNFSASYEASDFCWQIAPETLSYIVLGNARTLLEWASGPLSKLFRW